MEHDLMGGISPLLVYISLDLIIFINMQIKFKSREGVCCSTEDDLQEGGSVSATLLLKTLGTTSKPAVWEQRAQLGQYAIARYDMIIQNLESEKKNFKFRFYFNR